MKGSMTVVPALESAAGRGSGLDTMVQSITIPSGPVIQAVDTGGLDIPALMRHAAIQGSIVGFSNHAQSSVQGLTLSCDVAATVQRVNETNLAQNLKCRVPTVAAGDVMRRECHILDTQTRTGNTTRGRFP